MSNVIDFNLKQRLNADPMYAAIPPSTISALERYINDGIKPGGFLCAVLCNDLQKAFTRADLHNRAALYPLVMFLSNQCPSSCWGSEDAFSDWLMRRVK